MKYQIEAIPYGKYDVVVCGGGTAGCVAAIAAARKGAKTLLIERSFTVGGMLTVGEAGITKFTEHCKNSEVYKHEVVETLAKNPKDVQVVGGIAHELVMKLIANGNALGSYKEAGSYVFTDKAAMQVALIELLENAGVEVLYDTRVCLVEKVGEKVTAIVACNKEGFCRIEALQTIDATGDGDVAALAGVPFNKGATQEEVSLGYAKRVGELMAFGVMFRVRDVDFERLFDYFEKRPECFFKQEFGVMDFEDVRESYRRGDMCVFRIRLLEKSPKPTDDRVQVYNLPTKGEAILLGPLCGLGSDNDGLDARQLSAAQNNLQRNVYRLMECMRDFPGFENAVVTYIPDVGVRETRHIIGEYTLSVVDVLSGKNFEDSIACGGHPLDISPLPPEVENTDYDHWRFHIPYRVMLPQNADNLLVTGRCISASRGASGAIRTTAQCMALGEAAGIAAAMAAEANVSPKHINVNLLRQSIQENGGIL